MTHQIQCCIRAVLLTTSIDTSNFALQGLILGTVNQHMRISRLQRHKPPLQQEPPPGQLSMLTQAIQATRTHHKLLDMMLMQASPNQRCRHSTLAAANPHHRHLVGLYRPHLLRD